MSFKVLQSFLRSPLRGVVHLRSAAVSTNQDGCCCRELHIASNRQNPMSLAEAFLSKTKMNPVFRTHETDPSKHALKHEGLYYTIDKPVFDKLTLEKTYSWIQSEVKPFNEACLMVRRPALEIIHAMKHMNYNIPVPKFVLYGEKGCGKNMTLLHVMHYCLNNGWCILQTPWPQEWIQWYTEIANSTHKPGRIDLPVEAKIFLESFIKVNGNILDGHTTKFRYEWTKRESTEIGTPLNDLINFGLTRVKFADDVVGALLKEIKQLASEKKLKVLVVMDGINAFFYDSRMRVAKVEFKDTVQRQEKQEFIKASDISLIEHFKKLLQPDMVNSVCLSTADRHSNPRELREKNTPYYLLGKEGFALMDPFIPIHVPEYSDKEAYSCLEYYIDRMWISNPKGRTESGKKQLLFLSNKNPRILYKVCAAW